TNGDQTAPQIVADFIPRVAFHKNRPALHAGAPAAIAGPDKIAGISADAERAAAHFRPRPIGGVAVDLNRSAAHFGADVHADVALDGQFSRRHAAADELDAGTVAGKHDLLIAGVALDTK